MPYPLEHMLPLSWTPGFRLVVDDSVLVIPFTLDNVPDLFTVLESNRSHLRQWLPWIDRITDTDALTSRAQEWLGEMARGESLYNGVWLNQQLVGMLSYRRLDFSNRSTAIAYWLAKKATGKGIMTRSCRAAVAFAFTSLNLNRVEIRCARGNVQSQEVAKRLGFQAEGVMRQGLLLHGSFVDLLLFSMLRSEWKEEPTIL